MMKYLKKLALPIVVALISITIGISLGITIHKRQMQASAIGNWMMGVDSLKKKEYDYALFYLSQAIGQMNDDPLFYESMGDAYSAKQNSTMALDFYRLALERYEKEQTGPRKTLAHKIELLQAQLKEQVNK
jgi:tetratricopeptide (TPR) repeat protein